MLRWGWLPLTAALFAVDPPAAPDPDELLLQSAGVATDGPALVEFFHRLTLTDADRQTVAALLRQLGSDSFAERQDASRRLKAQGVRAVAMLRKSLHDDDPEIAHRAEELLAALPRSGPELTRAAARVLARRKPEVVSPR